ncbi:MAG: hypothetical protein P4L33_04730 [Capsulimonadaceae bacterium]|nr:hypothetical protein [Capsulimonadaceae bacterium]
MQYKQPTSSVAPATVQVRRLRRKARYLAEAGRVAEALGYQQALADLKPDDFDTLMQLGFMHRAVCEFEDAVVAFRRASGVAPHTPDPHEALAELYLDAARYDDAIAESKALLRLIPHSLAARDVLSTAYFQKGLINKALETMNEVVRLVPSDPLGHYKRGILFQHRGDWRHALHEFTRAAEMASEGSIEQSEAESAIEALDQHQIRQILMLVGEDRLFMLHLLRDADEAAKERGYYLSPGASAFVAQVTAEQMENHDPEFPQPQSRVVSSRMPRYN